MLECIFCNSKKLINLLCPQWFQYQKIIKNFGYFFKTKERKKDLLKIRDFVEKNFEFVGDKFSKKLEKFTMINKIIKQFMELLHKREMS